MKGLHLDKVDFESNECGLISFNVLFIKTFIT